MELNYKPTEANHQLVTDTLTFSPELISINNPFAVAMQPMEPTKDSNKAHDPQAPDIALQVQSSHMDEDRQSNVSLQSQHNSPIPTPCASQTSSTSGPISTDQMPRFQLNASPYEPDELHTDLDLRYMLASAYLSDACSGLEPQFKPDRSSVRLYCFYRKPFIRHLLLLILLIHHCLAMWEPITSEHRQKYPPSSGRVQYCMLIELCCLSYYGLLLVLRARFLPPLRFYADRKHLLLLCTLLLTLVDMLLFVAVPARHALRWSIAFRPLYAVNLAESRPIRRAIRNIRRTLPDIASVLFLFACSIFLFATIRTRLFRNVLFTTSDGQPVTGLLDFSYLLYILVTTANNPDIMMPAYRQNPLYALYFVIFLVVNLYLFMNLMLATIYSNYKKHLRQEVQQMQQARASSLRQCALILRPSKSASPFNDHKALQVENNQHSLSRMQFERLMYAYFRYWKVPMSCSGDHLQPLVQLLWALLQVDQVVPEAHLNQLVDLLNNRISLRPDGLHPANVSNKTFATPNSTRSALNQFYWSQTIKTYVCSMRQNLHRWVRSMHFRRFFDGLILLNALLIAFDAPFLNDVEFPLLLLFSFELIAKLTTFGFKCFIVKFWNIFDTFVIGSAVMLALITQSLRQYQLERSHQLPPWLLPTLEAQVDTLLILRVLRLCKLTSRIPRLRLAMVTIFRLLPHLLLYATLLILLLYTYAVLGMQNFSGLIDSRIQSRNCTLTSGRQVSYCDLTFDSLPASFLLLFDLLVVNQWHAFADTYTTLVSSRLVRLYFISFHIISVLIVLNIFTAFVLEAFALEFSNAINGDQDELQIRHKVCQMINSLSNQSEAACTKDASTAIDMTDVHPSLDTLDQLDADHETVQWIRSDQLHALACQAPITTNSPSSGSTGPAPANQTNVQTSGRHQRLQLIIRPKRSAETLLLKMFSN